MTIRVILADDHQVLRDALRSFLGREGDIEVVGEAADGRATLRLVRELQPDLVVMDVAMPGMNGFVAAARIRAAHRGTKVLALSAHDDKRYVVEMLSAGARGYVKKSAAGRELVDAIRAVAQGRSYLSPELAGAVVDGIQDIRGGPDGSGSLSPREVEVLQLLAEGHRTPDIAARLFIAVATVEVHRRNIMRKVGLHTVADLTKFAIREGLTKI